MLSEQQARPLEPPLDHPDETSREDRIQRIVVAYRESIHGSGSLSVEEIVARHPDLADELRSRLHAVAAETPTLAPSLRTALPGDATTAPEASSLRPAGHAVATGTQIGDYRLLRELGRGGMGVVFEAEHVSSERRLAVKLLSPDLPHTEQTIARFLNEASLAAGLSHPRTTFVYEAGERDGHFFIGMELMPGRTLKDLVQTEGALSVNRAVDFTIDVLTGLDAAHGSGVVHRDVKPSNCFLDQDGRAKVGDFGLSKSLVSTSDLTLTGAFLGTPQFAAPEQFGRGKVDHRTDIFATAATLYYLIAGRPPFEGDPAAVIAQIVADDPPALTGIRSEVPASLSRIVARGLNKDPDRRYKDAREFINALMPYATGGTSTATLGRRVAAYFIDSILVAIFFTILFVFGSIFWGLLQNEPLGVNYSAIYSVLHGVVLLIYFASFEGLFGRSIGKRWLGLRLADRNGEPPGLLRATLRAVVVPGLTWVWVDFLQAIYTPNWEATAGIPTDYSVILIPQLLALLRGVLCLVACCTMRRSNGFRGVHEFVSGTRVVRPRELETTTTLHAVPQYAAVAAEDSAKSIGGFSLRGMLATTGSTRIFVARDEQLERPVWVQVGDSEIAFSRARRNVSRSTRQRWLGEGREGDLYWQAFEAIAGAPLPEACRYAPIPWDTARHIWLQTGEELKCSLEEGTLPTQLGIHQLWTDARGRLRLCDQTLNANNADEKVSPLPCASSDDDTADIDRVTRLLKEVGELCTVDDETPSEALDLLKELETHPPQASTEEVVNRLRQLAERPYRLRWDDRLGSMAVAAGLEAAVLSPIPMAMGSVLTTYGWSLTSTMVLAAMLGEAVCGLLGYLMQGGPAFWLSSIEVRTPDGQASPGRCAWRNFVTWLPMMFLYATIGVTAGELIRTGGIPESPVLLMMSGVYQALFVAVAALGALFALTQPRKGFQDLLAGTFLVRRVGKSPE